MNIPLNIDWQQILLHLLNFVILAGGLYLLLYKPVKTFMEKRQQYYQEQDAKAAKTLADAEKTAAEVRQQLKNADADAAAKPPPPRSRRTPPCSGSCLTHGHRRNKFWRTPMPLPSGSMTSCCPTRRRS